MIPVERSGRQLIRSAPSASGNLDEADEAFSDADFVCKMKLVLRETKESRRWLRFIKRCKLARHDRVDVLEDEARQLASIFSTIIKNRQANLANAKRAKQNAAKRS